MRGGGIGNGIGIVRVLVLVLVLVLGVFGSGVAWGHKPSDSYLTLTVHGARVDGRWDIALRDLNHAIGIDADGDGAITWNEVRARHDAIADYALGRLSLGGGGGPCPARAREQKIVSHSDGAYTVLRFMATCPAAIDGLGVGYLLFADVDPQHRGLVRVDAGGEPQPAIYRAGDPPRTITPMRAEEEGTSARPLFLAALLLVVVPWLLGRLVVIASRTARRSSSLPHPTRGDRP